LFLAFQGICVLREEIAYEGSVNILFVYSYKIVICSQFWYQFPNTAAATPTCAKEQIGSATATLYWLLSK
jgi:hypothetical protein